MDAISDARLQQVNPILAARVRQLEQTLGFEIRVTQGLRTSAEQTALYAQGRLALVTVNLLRKQINQAPITQEENIRVTDAAPGQSWHEYGLAVDVVPMVPTPDWNESHPTWQKIVQSAVNFQLKDGIGWRDEPHLQPIEIPLSPTPQYIAMLASQSFQACWKLAGLVEQSV